MRAVNEHDLAKVTAHHLGESRRLWQELLREGSRDWLTPYAVALAREPDTATDVVREMFRDRREQLRELSDEIVTRSRQYAEQDAFELMTQNNEVLRRLMTLIGIRDLPPLELPPFNESG